MCQETDEMDLKVAWQNLGLGEFSPQMNLLTELIQEDQPQGQAPWRLTRMMKLMSHPD